MSTESIVTTSWWEAYRSAVRRAETHRVEVFVRSLAPVLGGHNRHDRFLEQLERAKSAGLLDEYRISLVGDRLCLCESCLDTSHGRQLATKLETIRGWHGETMEPLGFEEKVVDSSITGEQYRVLVPPVLSLAVSVDDELQGVFPSAVEGDPYDVDDYLEALTAARSAFQPSRIDTR